MVAVTETGSVKVMAAVVEPMVTMMAIPTHRHHRTVHGGALRSPCLQLPRCRRAVPAMRRMKLGHASVSNVELLCCRSLVLDATRN